MISTLCNTASCVSPRGLVCHGRLSVPKGTSAEEAKAVSGLVALTEKAVYSQVSWYGYRSNKNNTDNNKFW